MKTKDKYLTAPEVLDALFTDESRPSQRTWVRRVKEGRVPHVKLGGKMLFQLEDVRHAISKAPKAQKNGRC
jgi:hypothetical protein